MYNFKISDISHHTSFFCGFLVHVLAFVIFPILSFHSYFSTYSHQSDSMKTGMILRFFKPKHIAFKLILI